MDGSPCDVMQDTAAMIFGFVASLTSQIVKPAKLPWTTYLSLNAMSELMKVSPRDVSNIAAFGENETRRMLSAASPASRRPGFRLDRASFGGYVWAKRGDGRKA